MATQLLSRPTPKVLVESKSYVARNVSALMAAVVAFALIFRGQATMHLDRSSLTPLHDWLNNLGDWIDRSRNSNPFFTYVVNEIRAFINGLVSMLRDGISVGSSFRPVPQVGWLGIVAIIGLVVYLISNIRVALLAVTGFVFLGLLGLWTESMDTLALTLAAVVLSLIIGIPLGICAGLFPKFERMLTPVLDFAQVMPTFVYLTPVTLFFLIGPASATIVTLIYAIPPALRITAVAIKEVPWSSVEASTSMGSTRMQALRKVQLPQAKRTIVVGINQTIMAALAMVTIAALIDAPGLGKVVVRALTSLDVGRSFQAGLAIVILAVVLDRSTTAAAAKVSLDPTIDRPSKYRRLALIGAGVITVLLVYLSRTYVWASTFPGTGAMGRMVASIADNITNWIQLHFVTVTNGITDSVSYGLINPMQSLLVESPWFVTGAMLIGLGMIFGGIRLGLVSALCVLALFGTGLWSDAMITLASTLVAAAITVVLGIFVGVWIGRNPRADRWIRPLLDAGQVLPAFVYLVPFLGLFGPTRFTAIMAAVVYAAPASIKLMADGIRGVPATITEAATAAGSSPWQMIVKVQLPTARRALALATNQGLIYVLAMIVVGGLVGAGGLGYLVVAGFSQENLKGKGLAAGLAIVILGILIDRLTQAVANKRDSVAQARA
ncbi:MAG: ABC transporter permease subunit [Candidatus Nanopelagicaceae bacterium]|nr:ABC transporter permease subunit [Candidatus Nanopelagicaceae bacterium]